MKKLLAIAALLLASSAAQAQYTFDYGGKTIRIDPDRGTVQIPGVYDNTGRKGKRSRDDDDYRDDARGRDDSRNRDDARYRDRDDARNRDDARDDYRDQPRRRPPQDARTRPANEPDQVTPAAPAPAEQAAVPPAPVPAPAASAPVDSSTTTAAVAPAETTTPAAPPPPAPAPQVQQEPPPAPRPSVAAAAPPPAPSDPDSPLGVWQTEKKDGKEGKVRIEPCGANLCGYSIDRSNRNGEQVLINMRPGNNKWTGRIVDPSSGSKYDSTIALKGTDKLRVQGCAFGGMFCGGQTWTRVN
jgi:hypothetical protein